jgi:hypothetical protein
MFSKNFTIDRSYHMQDGVFYQGHQKIADHTSSPVIKAGNEEIYVFNLMGQSNFPYVVLTNAGGTIRVFRCYKVNTESNIVEFTSIDDVKGVVCLSEEGKLSIALA